MSGLLFTIVLSGTGCGLAVAGCWLTIKRLSLKTGNGLMAAGNWLLFLNGVVIQNPISIALNGFAAAFCTWLWWRNGGGKRGRKAARELGAKSKARVQALARQMTPSPIPVPGGAR